MQSDTKDKRTTVLSGKVPVEFRKKIRLEAALLDVNASRAVAEGLKLWLVHRARICPMCDQRTVAPHPDELMARAGVLYCTACQECVVYSPNGNN